MIFDLTSYLHKQQKLVEEALKKYLPAAQAFPENLHQSMHYSLFAGGKRIRPILCLAAVAACGGRGEEALPIASALEMIHTFSLIHDDLPAMDDDDLRRGKPTNHKIYGEATAILAGDALLAHAFDVICQTPTHIKKDILLEILQDIARATGSLGMVGGQVYDMESEGKKIDPGSLKKLHQLKTGRLIEVAVTSGAKLATADAGKIHALKKYGEALGLAFQIADDILDVEGGEEIGKDVGSDAARGKSTFPSVLGMAEAKAFASRTCEQALAALNDFDEEAQPLQEIARYVIARKN